ncbi:MAG: ABC transporter permease [Oscillospiraceae bacterium]|nr:ABC transporter permease [Oscillospiraceae bacterium]
MRVYFSMFKMRLIAGMQYRAAAWAGVATQFFWGFMNLMVYQAFYASSGTEPPMPWPQLVSYIWLRQAFLAIVMLWVRDGELLRGIADGHVAYELCRPYDLFKTWFARLSAMRVSSAAMRCVPILTLGFFLPAQYRMPLPAGFGALGLFLLSLALSLLLVTAISMFIYILTFITLSPIGSMLIITVAAEFLQGSLIPVPLMPEPLQRFLDFLPFRYTSDLPFRIYSGGISGYDALLQTGVQILWIVVLLLLGNAALKRVLRRVVIQGG